MNESLERQETAIVKSRLDRILEKRAIQHKVILVLDTSGSMASQADSPGERRIDALRGVVTMLRNQGIAPRQLVFNSDVMWSDVIPEPSGGTNLAGALKFCKQLNPEHVIVVSDGEPDDISQGGAASIAAAKALNCKVDVFFVGPKDMTHAKEFMDRLAVGTGGSSQTVSFKELEQKIAGMLTAGDAADEKKGSIAL